jgi:hypothetical protein
MMRWKASIFSLLLTLAIGIAVVRLSSVIDWLWPSFSIEEAAPIVGHRVRHRYTEKFRAMKCPEEGGVCREVREGESGTVVRIVKVPDGGYFLEVRWDESKSQSYYSYFGRYTHRESLIVE